MHIAAKGLAAVALLTCTQAVDAQSYGFATYSAFVLASGVTSRGSGVQGSANAGLGKYNVTFTRPVDTCVANVSLNGAILGFTTSVNLPGNPNTITVYTFSNSGAAANRPFQVIVTCAS